MSPRVLEFLRYRLATELRRAAAEVREDGRMERDTKAAQMKAQRNLPEPMDHTPPLWRRAEAACVEEQRSAARHRRFMAWRAARVQERQRRGEDALPTVGS